jgi:hypothetical protein
MKVNQFGFVLIASLFATLPAMATIDTDVKDQAFVNLGNVKNGSSISYKENEKGELLSNNNSKFHIFQWVKFGNERGVLRLSGTDIVLTPTDSSKTVGLSLYSPNKGQVLSIKPTPRMGGMYNVITESNMMVCTANSQADQPLYLRKFVPGQTIDECEFGIGQHQDPGSLKVQVIQAPKTITSKNRRYR